MISSIRSLRIVRHTGNYDEMRSFYQDGLDMRPTAEWDRSPTDRGVLLVFNGPTSATCVEVLTYPGAGDHQSSGTTSSGALTIAVEVMNAGAQYEALRQRGVEIIRELETMPWGHLSFSVRDPDGLEISFYQDMNSTADG